MYSYHCAIRGEKLQFEFLFLASAFTEVTSDFGPKLGEMEESWWVLLRMQQLDCNLNFS